MSLFETKADLSLTESKYIPWVFCDKCIGVYDDYMRAWYLNYVVSIFNVGFCKINEHFMPIGITGHRVIPTYNAFDKRVYTQQFDVYCNNHQLTGKKPGLKSVADIKADMILDFNSVCRSFYVMHELGDYESLAEDIKLIVKYSFSGDDYQECFEEKKKLVTAKTKIHIFPNIWEIKKPYRRINKYHTFI